MPEYDIDKQIEKFWEIVRRQVPDEDFEILEQIVNAGEPGFIDPARNNPVKVVDFVRFFDPASLLNLLRSAYPYFDFIDF